MDAVDTYLLSIVESPKVATCNVIKINLVVDLLKKCFFVLVMKYCMFFNDPLI
jgi:hypothetical protein